jgi:hypothetical protein
MRMILRARTHTPPDFHVFGGASHAGGGCGAARVRTTPLSSLPARAASPGSTSCVLAFGDAFDPGRARLGSALGPGGVSASFVLMRIVCQTLTS